MRGLKFCNPVNNAFLTVVALLASAWIEIFEGKYILSLPGESHSSRVRGLKYINIEDETSESMSHSSRVRGLKLFISA